MDTSEIGCAYIPPSDKRSAFFKAKVRGADVRFHIADLTYFVHAEDDVIIFALEMSTGELLHVMKQDLEHIQLD